jgi:transposase
LPKDLPPDSTVFYHYNEWRKAGTIEKLMHVLHERVREQKKKPKWTTLIMIDAQARASGEEHL